MQMGDCGFRSVSGFERIALIDHGPISHNLTVIPHHYITESETGGLILTDRDPFHHHPELRGRIKPASESFFRDWDLSALDASAAERGALPIGAHQMKNAKLVGTIG